ncbi:hypothetical protein SAMN04488066_101355 [Halorubrum aquaticum]|uniref:DUF8053 domain-containing protein n=1 Tax=Halorubrum aquaticum TaxID=387340 RepID=A0A1I2Z8Z0_9EURY|nr:hypothetical protein [Halorubrum aquaticum]SFH34312.1 hypothetical protein SAMN04488066_101355 [Halorubrum aquaticum]
MPGEIRKLNDQGNGSGSIVIPKDALREWGLVDEDDGSVMSAHLHVTTSDDGVVMLQPLGEMDPTNDSPSKRSTGRSIPASKADL